MPLASWPACHVSLQRDQSLEFTSYLRCRVAPRCLQKVHGMRLCRAGMTGSPAVLDCVLCKRAGCSKFTSMRSTGLA